MTQITPNIFRQIVKEPSTLRSADLAKSAKRQALLCYWPFLISLTRQVRSNKLSPETLKTIFNLARFHLLSSRGSWIQTLSLLGLDQFYQHWLSQIRLELQFSPIRLERKGIVRLYNQDLLDLLDKARGFSQDYSMLELLDVLELRLNFKSKLEA